MTTRTTTLSVLVVFVLVAAAPLHLTAQDETKGISFESPDQSFELSKQKAQASGRLLMVDFYADWCSWCKRLDEEAFSDPHVGKLMKNFVNVKINAETDDGRALARTYGVTGYPFILFLNGDGEVIDWILGYASTEEFLARVQEIRAGRTTYYAYKKRFEADPTDLEAAVAYAERIYEREQKKKARTIYEAALEVARKEKRPEGGLCIEGLVPYYLEARDLNGLVALLEEQIADYPDTDGIEDSYLLLTQIYSQVMKDMPKTFTLLKQAVAKFTGTEFEDNMRYNLAVLLEQTGELDAALAEYEKIDDEEGIEQIVKPAKVRILLAKGERELVLAICRRWREEAGKDVHKINGLAWICHENKILLAEALGWAKVAVELDNAHSAAIIDTLSWLYYDNGEYAIAVEWEQKALAAATNDEQRETFAKALKTFRQALTETDR